MIEKTTQIPDDLIVRILNNLLSKIKTKEDIELYKELRSKFIREPGGIDNYMIEFESIQKEIYRLKLT